MKHGVGKLTASDITGGTRTWLIGICSPFHAEDFGALLAWAGANLGDGKGGWNAVIPAPDGGPARPAVYEVTRKGGRFKEVVL